MIVFFFVCINAIHHRHGLLALATKCEQVHGSIQIRKKDEKKRSLSLFRVLYIVYPSHYLLKINQIKLQSL